MKRGKANSLPGAARTQASRTSTAKAQKPGSERGLSSASTGQPGSIQAKGKAVDITSKKATGQKSTKEEDDTKQSPLLDSIIQLRDKLQYACNMTEDELQKQPIDGRRTPAKVAIDECIAHADMLSDYVTRTRKVRGINKGAQEKTKEQEVKQRLQTVNGLLEILRDQTRKNTYDVMDFEKKQGRHDDMKKSKEILSDICRVLHNRSKEINEEEDRRHNIYSNFKKEIGIYLAIPTPQKKGEKKNATEGVSNNLQNLQEILKAVKEQVENIKLKSQALYGTLKEWRDDFNEKQEKKTKQKTKPITEQSKVVEILLEVEALQKEQQSCISETNKGIDKELDDLTKEITEWNEIRNIEKPNPVLDKTTVTIRGIREEIFKKKKEAKEARETKAEGGTESKMELQSLEEKIRDLWSAMNDDNNSSSEQKRTIPPTAAKMLDGLKKRLVQNKDDINNLNGILIALKTEIGNLKNDVQEWDNEIQTSMIRIDKDSPDALKETRQARILLRKKKEDVREIIKRSTENAEREQTLQKQLAEIDIEIYGKPENTSQAGDSDMLGRIRNGLNKMEKDAFHIEEGCMNIYLTITGVKTNEEKSDSILDLMTKCKKNIKSCENEVKLFVSEFQELAKECLPHYKMEESICKSIRDFFKRMELKNNKTREVIDSSTASLSKTFLSLKNYPYLFRQVNLDANISRGDDEPWIQQLDRKVKEIECCVEENKEGFEHRFIEIETIRDGLDHLFRKVMVKEYNSTGNDGRESSESKRKNKKQNQKEMSKSTDPRAVVIERLAIIRERVSTIVDASEKNENRCQSLQVEVEKCEGEKQSLLMRLSKVAGAKLTDNNPNIADLGDKNRPTKIAEEYSELYDNEWTDAYEIQEKSDTTEETSLKFLHKILTTVYDECGKYAQNQDYTIRSMLLCPTVELHLTENADSKGAKSEKDSKRTLDLPAIQSKAVSDLRKQTADECTDDVTKFLKKTRESWFKKKPLEKYTTRCIKLCWLMQVQTPPLHIESDVKTGSKFDKDRYREYTRSGKKVDFVVWPALALTKGGPILAKGVAQGRT